MTEDPVNKPSHYTQGAIECIVAIEASMSSEEFMGWLKGNVLKYIWRWREKGGVQDLAKAKYYLTKLEERAQSITPISPQMDVPEIQTPWVVPPRPLGPGEHPYVDEAPDPWTNIFMDGHTTAGPLGTYPVIFKD